MKKFAVRVLFVLSALLCLSAPPASAGVDVNVNIGIPFPGFRVEAAPDMVLAPDAPVYFAPRASVDLFFFDGFWFTRNEGRWYRGPDYRGPWKGIAPRYVPAPVFRVRPDYRDRWGRGDHVPYGQLKNHWRERRVREDHRGDRDRGEYREHDRRDGDDRGWKEEKRDRKYEEKERKEMRKEEKREGKGRGKGRNDD